jgi:hypothetical protein
VYKAERRLEALREKQRVAKLGPRVSGVVKFFDSAKGFGFISCADGREAFVSRPSRPPPSRKVSGSTSTLDAARRVRRRTTCASPACSPDLLNTNQATARLVAPSTCRPQRQIPTEGARGRRNRPRNTVSHSVSQRRIRGGRDAERRPNLTRLPLVIGGAEGDRTPGL